LRFEIFRSLGPARTLALAYVTYCNRASKGCAGRIPGQWHRDSSKYRWVDRARDFDLHILAEHGRDVAITFLELMRELSQRTLRAVVERNYSPSTWEDAVKALDALGKYIGPETLKLAATDAGEARPKHKIVG